MSIVSLSRNDVFTSAYNDNLIEILSLVPYTDNPESLDPFDDYPSLYSCRVTDFHVRMKVNYAYYRHDEVLHPEETPPSNIHIVFAIIRGKSNEFFNSQRPISILTTDVGPVATLPWQYNLFYPDSHNILFTTMVDTNQVYDLSYSNSFRLESGDQVVMILGSDLPSQEGKEITASFSYNVSYTVHFE